MSDKVDSNYVKSYSSMRESVEERAIEIANILQGHSTRYGGMKPKRCSYSNIEVGSNALQLTVDDRDHYGVVEEEQVFTIPLQWFDWTDEEITTKVKKIEESYQKVRMEKMLEELNVTADNLGYRVVKR